MTSSDRSKFLLQKLALLKNGAPRINDLQAEVLGQTVA
jgi:hypothetical protein